MGVVSPMSKRLRLPYPFDKRLMDPEPVWVLWRKISFLSPDSSVFLPIAYSLYGLIWRVQKQRYGLGGLSSTRLHGVLSHAPRRHENRITLPVKSKLQDVRSLKRPYRSFEINALVVLSSSKWYSEIYGGVVLKGNCCGISSASRHNFT